MTSFSKRIMFAVLAVFFAVSTTNVFALKISSYYSPHDRERKQRPKTEFIILHTTEGPKKGSLKKVWRNGEAHYLVDRDGHVYRIIHRNKIAYHAGRSMWNGERNLDECSIGIEVVGYHNRDITDAQYKALRELIAELQRIYKIPDRKVLTHSMVAYGRPNRWHKKSHRGRKRCAMNLATYNARMRLGITDWPRYDPDVNAGRLTVADPLLEKALYGNAHEQIAALNSFNRGNANVIGRGRTAWDIARDRYKSAGTKYILPNGKVLRGNQISNWKSLPAGTRVLVSRENPVSGLEKIKTVKGRSSSAHDLAGDEYKSKTTIYFFTSGKIITGDKMSRKQLAKLPYGTKVLVGYEIAGCISKKKNAFAMCGLRWDDPSTIYYFPDKTFKCGNEVNERNIPRKTYILLQK